MRETQRCGDLSPMFLNLNHHGNMFVSFSTLSFQVISFIYHSSLYSGTGTMICSCFGEKWSKTLLFVGIFQLFLAYILIGWIFSIYWGVLIVRKSWEDEKELKTFLDKTNLKSD